MRKTSFGLGLAGTIVAFVIGAIMLIVALIFGVVSHVDWDYVSSDFDDIEVFIDDGDFALDIDDEDFSLNINDEDFYLDIDDEFRGEFGGFPNTFTRAIGGWLLFASIALLVSGVLGIIGIVITKKRRSVAAGILLLIAGVLSIFSLYGLHATALLIPSGVLAFMKDKNEQIEIEE